MNSDRGDQINPTTGEITWAEDKVSASLAPSTPQALSFREYSTARRLCDGSGGDN